MVMEINKTEENPNQREHDVFADSFFFQLVRIRKVMVRRSNHLMTEAGITLPVEQLPLLVILHRHGMLSQRELSDITMRDKSSILRSVSALQKKGLVTVAQDSIDKRKNNISLTGEGVASAKTIKLLMRKAEDEVLSVFTNEERILALQAVKGFAEKLESAD